MTTIREVVEALESLAPPGLAESWDNVGLQVGELATLVEKALLCLDVDEAVIEEAQAGGFQLIIAHHPLFFGELKAVTDETPSGRLALSAINAGIAVYSAHTNLDKVAGGLNDALADLFDLRETTVLDSAAEGGSDGLGRLGRLIEPVGFREFMDTCRRRISSEIRVVGEVETVSMVAVCGGSGAALIGDAYAAGADVFVTGDVKYHDAQRARECGLMVVDAGHDGTERAGLRAWLSRVATFLPVSVSEARIPRPLWRQPSEDGS